MDAVPDGRLRYDEKRRNAKRTTNLSLMAWYRMHGLELLKIDWHPKRDAVFVYDDPGDTAEQLRIAWANSQAKDHDDERRNLRTLIVEKQREMRRRNRGGGQGRAQ